LKGATKGDRKRSPFFILSYSVESFCNKRFCPIAFQLLKGATKGDRLRSPLFILSSSVESFCSKKFSPLAFQLLKGACSTSCFM
jgi:hypothetical protein